MRLRPPRACRCVGCPIYRLGTGPVEQLCRAEFPSVVMVLRRLADKKRLGLLSAIMLFFQALSIAAALLNPVQAAPQLAARQADPYVNQTTCNGLTYTYQQLAGFGFIPSDARDKYGDTIGGIGSAIAIDKFSWLKVGKRQPLVPRLQIPRRRISSLNTWIRSSTKAPMAPRPPASMPMSQVSPVSQDFHRCPSPTTPETALAGLARAGDVSP